MAILRKGPDGERVGLAEAGCEGAEGLRAGWRGVLVTADEAKGLAGEQIHSPRGCTT